MLLNNKICLVTGANRGIGKAIVARFAEEGAIVYAHARSLGSLEKSIEELNAGVKGKVYSEYFDITDTPSIKNCIARIKKEQGQLDVLVNNAGIMKDALIGMITDEMIQETLACNVVAPMQFIQYASKIMKRQKSGSIINMSSLVATNGNKYQMLYAASKGAISSLTKSAAKELAQNNIRVNAIAPGMIETDLFFSIGEDLAEQFSNNIGMGRIGTTAEVADTCVFFASDLSRYVTGQILGVDGSAVM